MSSPEQNYFFRYAMRHPVYMYVRINLRQKVERVETTAEMSSMSSQRVIGVDVGGTFTTKNF